MATVKQSPQDERKFVPFVLENGLRVVVVSDPKADKAAASLTVAVGHFSDPDDLPGLAHFTEHMLFLGSEKYPAENEYNTFLTSHGGRSNAYTTAENTNYYFDVAVDALPTALDIFANFFIAPTMAESAAAREMRAVDSEHQKNYRSDMWRLSQLVRHSSKEGCRFRKFGTGNLSTLDVPGISERLAEFHQKHYTAERMGLVVLSSAPAEELLQLVKEAFGPVRAADTAKASAARRPDEGPADIFGKEELQWLYSLSPIQDKSIVRMVFPLDSHRSHYRCKPTRYLGHLVGHEGPGSVFAKLKSKGWALSLSAGVSQHYETFELFNVTVELTPEGVKEFRNVVATVVAYLRMLQAQGGVPEWVFHELQAMGKVNFDFQEHPRAINLVTSLSPLLSYVPVEDLLTVDELFEEFDAHLVAGVVSRLTPENVVVFLSSKNLPEDSLDECEPWYSSKFKRQRLQPDDIDNWIAACNAEEGLHLPKRNPFIPDNLVLLPGDPIADHVGPALVDLPGAPAGFKLWFLADPTFRTPKASVRCNISVNSASASPEAQVLCRLYIDMCEDSLNEFSYFADICGLFFSLHYDSSGVEVSFEGYSQKLPVLAETVLQRMKALQIDPERFDIIKTRYQRQLENLKIGAATNIIEHVFSHAMSVNYFNIDSKLAVLPHLTAAHLQDFVAALWSAANLEMLVHGNITQEDAVALLTMAKTTLSPRRPLFEAETTMRRIVQLPKGVSVVEQDHADAQNPNSALYYYIQAGWKDLRLQTLIDLLAHILLEPAFDQLRTKEALGYIVWSGARSLYGTHGYRIIVQSSDYLCDHLHSRAEEFLHSQVGALAGMTDDDFEQAKAALAVKKKERDTKLRQRSQRFWVEIDHHQYLFDRVPQQLEILKTLQKDDVVGLLKSFLSPDSAVLSIHLYKQGAPRRGKAGAFDKRADARIEFLEDIDLFKRRLFAFPNYY